jgi:hypothetical protein
MSKDIKINIIGVKCLFSYVWFCSIYFENEECYLLGRYAPWLL